MRQLNTRLDKIDSAIQSIPGKNIVRLVIKDSDGSICQDSGEKNCSHLITVHAVQPDVAIYPL